MLSIKELISSAGNGPLITAELYDIYGNGKLRIVNNECIRDANDSSSFEWILNKIDDTHITLSPFKNKTTYISFIQTNPGFYQLGIDYNYPSNGKFAITPEGIGCFQLTIENNTYPNNPICYNPTINGLPAGTILGKGVFRTKTQWFIKITNTLQPNIAFKQQDFSIAGIKEQFKAMNKSFDIDLVSKIANQMK